MTHSVLRFIGLVIALVLTTRLVPGISTSGGWTTVLLVAFVWSLITLFIRPILRILTFPITLLTFGLFSLVLNALLLWSVTYIVPEFQVSGFIAALCGSVVLSLLSWIINEVL